MNGDVDPTPATAAYALTGTVTATPAYPGPQRIDTPSHRPVPGATVTLTATCEAPDPRPRAAVTALIRDRRLASGLRRPRASARSTRGTLAI